MTVNILIIFFQIKIFVSTRSFKYLNIYFKDLNKFKELKTIKQETEKKETNVYDTALELYNELLERYFDEYCYLSHAKRTKINGKCKPKNLFIKGYDYSEWSKNEEESTDKEESIDKEESVDLRDMLPLEVKEGKGLEILTPNKLLTRLPILLAQIKAGSNSCKLQNYIR